jgi:hypothetical protein
MSTNTIENENVTVTEAVEVETVEVADYNENATVLTAKQVERLEDTQSKMEIDPRELVIIPSRNSRQTKSDNKVLKDSIRKHGVLQSVSVYVSPGEPGIVKGSLVLAAGYSRCATCVELTEETNGERIFKVPYRLISFAEAVGAEGQTQLEREVYIAGLAENFHRKELTEADIINAILFLTGGRKDIGTKEATEIGAHFGKSAAWVTQHINMTIQLAPEVQTALQKRPNEAGHIPGSVLMEVMKVGVPEGKKFSELTEEEKQEVFAAQQQYVKDNSVKGNFMLSRDQVKSATKNVGNDGDEGEVNDGPKPVNMKQLREDLLSMQMPDAKRGEHIPTDVSKDFLAYLDGKIKIRGFSNRLEKIMGVAAKDRMLVN